MLAALADTLAACETNADVGAVVLTGAGVAFCAAGDVKGMAEAQDGARRLPLHEGKPESRRRRRLSRRLGALTQDHREAAKAFVEKRTPQFVRR